MFKTATGTDFLIVHYRGGALAMTDLISGQMQMMIEVMPNAMPQVESGKLRAGGVNAGPLAARFRAPHADRIRGWDALFAPRGTPRPIIDALSGAVQKPREDPQLKQTLLARGARTTPSTPGELREHVASELKRWGAVVLASGAKVD